MEVWEAREIEWEKVAFVLTSMISRIKVFQLAIRYQRLVRHSPVRTTGIPAPP